jgi:hypothetical protein
LTRSWCCFPPLHSVRTALSKIGAKLKGGDKVIGKLLSQHVIEEIPGGLNVPSRLAQ